MIRIYDIVYSRQTEISMFLLGGIVEKRRSLKIFGPLPKAKTGIAQYSYHLGLALQKYFDVEFVYGDQDEPVEVDEGVQIVSLQDFRCRAEDSEEIRLYHVGSNHYHVCFVEEIIAHSGHIVLHDWTLNYLNDLYARKMNWDDARSYVQQIAGYSDGYYGALLASPSAHQSADILSGYIGYSLSANRHLLESARGIFVHSKALAHRINKSGYPSTYVPHFSNPVATVADSIKLQIRKKLAIEDDEYLMISMGFASKSKQIERNIKALGRLRSKGVSVSYIHVGGVENFQGMCNLAEVCGVADFVHFTGYTSDETFDEYVYAADIVLANRFPWAGESSGVVAKCAAKGKAIIVNNIGSYAELPDDAVVKLNSVDDIDHLANAIYSLVSDRAVRERFELGALNYAKSVQLDKCALMFSKSISELRENGTREGWNGYFSRNDKFRQIIENWRPAVTSFAGNEYEREVLGKKILILSPWVVWADVMGGGQVRSYNLARELAQRNCVKILATVYEGESISIKDCESDLEVLQVPRSRSALDVIDAWNSCIEGFGHYSAAEFVKQDRGFQKELSLLLEWADVLVFSHPFLWSESYKSLGKKIVYDSHNFEYDIARDTFCDVQNGGEAIERIRQQERSLSLNADIIWSCSEIDRENLISNYGVDGSKIFHVGNGCNINPYTFDTFQRKRSTQKDLFGCEVTIGTFIGSNWPPNNRALQLILHAAWANPRILFVVLGGCCDSVEDNNNIPGNVFLLGKVSGDLKEKLLSLSTFTLNPILSGDGAGSNVKVAEYGIARTVLLSTAFGVRGYGLKIGEGYLPISADLSLLQKELEKIDMLSDLDLEKLSESFYVSIKNEYTWTAIAQVAAESLQRDC